MTIEIGNQIRGVGSALVGTEVVTTSNDGITTLTVLSKRKHLYTGSGSNHVVSLPAANTLQIGDQFEIINSSSEFVIVKNSGTASSVFEFVAPNASLTATASGVSTAAGTWAACNCSVPVWYTDFDGVVSTTFDAGFGTTASGTAAAPGIGSDTTRLGIKQFSTGSTTTGRIALNKNPFNMSITTGAPAYMFAGEVALSALSDGTETYTFDLGFGDSHTDVEHTDGAVIRYNHTQSANCQLVAINGGVAGTPVVSTVPIATAFNVFNIVSISNGGGFYAYYGKKYLGKIVAGIPSSLLCVFVKIVKSAGTTARRFDLDWCALYTARKG